MAKTEQKPTRDQVLNQIKIDSLAAYAKEVDDPTVNNLIGCVNIQNDQIYIVTTGPDGKVIKNHYAEFREEGMQMGWRLLKANKVTEMMQ